MFENNDIDLGTRTFVCVSLFASLAENKSD